MNLRKKEKSKIFLKKEGRSLLNFLESTNMETSEPLVTAKGMAATTSSTSNKSKGETPVEDMSYAVYRPFPTTHQVIMPFHGRAGWGITSATTAGGIDWIKIRLNSLTDIFNAASTRTEVPLTPHPTDTLTGTLTTPIMKNYWDTIYKVYTVIACKYKITYRMETDTRSDAQVMIYKYMHGAQDPPLLDGGNTNILTHAYRQHHPHCEFKALNTNPGFGSNVIDVPGTTATPTTDIYGYEPMQPNTVNNNISFTGVWKPGMIKHDVLEDDDHQTWIHMDKTPTQFEQMTFMVTHSPYTVTNVACGGSIFVDLEYIVQLKDLKIDYEYIRDNTSIGAVSNFANQANTSAMEL